MNYVFNTWKKIFGNWKYFLLTFLIAFLFYSLNVVISNMASLIKFYSEVGLFKSLTLFFSLLLGFKDTVLLSSFISIIIISILFGMLVSLLTYRKKLQFNKINNVGFISGIGLILASFVPGCAACGVGLASVIGLSAGFLTFLPYKGLELSILSIIILATAIIQVTNKLYKCNIVLKNERR